MERASGYAEQGYVHSTHDGVTSNVMLAYPACTVTVYDSGTTTLSAIYSDDASTPKANPFTAGNDASWYFYAADGAYDVQFSGSGVTTPFSNAGILLNSASYVGAVSSVFGRTGNVTAQANDYSFSQLSGTVAVAQLPVTGGDLSGTLSNAAVIGLQGTSVSSTAPTPGQSLVYDSSASAWAPGSPSGIDHSDLDELDYASAGHTGFVSLTGTQTLTNKTLTTPVIGDFTSATHAHAAAGSGGQLTDAALSSAVTAAKGGTGQSTYTKGDILVASAATTLTKLGVGPNNAVLMADSSTATGVKWAAASAASSHNLLSATHADTTAGSRARGDLIIGGASAWTKLAVGTAGKVLKSDGTDPAWGSAGLKATSSLDFGSTSAQSSTDLQIGVSGAVVGDPVVVALPASPDANTCFTAWVSVDSVVTVRFNNYSSGVVDPGAGSYTVMVLK